MYEKSDIAEWPGNACLESFMRVSSENPDLRLDLQHSRRPERHGGMKNTVLTLHDPAAVRRSHEMALWQPGFLKQFEKSQTNQNV